ncbi:hypothetical protein AB0F96_32965 [Streptomyces sp. NPDC023998]|uniref:hypothetical protein n=1 Tax=Streptomyces sp. NPDC023998 TaxID=3154597 RepID=UPI0033C66A62
MNAELKSAHLFFDAAHWIAWSSPYLAALALFAGVVWARRERKRARLVKEALFDRVTVEVVPTSTFDPGEGEIGRWARQLGRVHHAAGGVPARGSAARLRYSAEDSKMRCFLEGPAAAAAVLAMPGFAEVEVRAQRAQKGIQPVRFPVPVQREGAK